MAAATLMFGRVGMKDVDTKRGGEVAKSVKEYVRFSMANRWSDAQGDDETCPRIPELVRAFYLNFLDVAPFVHREPVVSSMTRRMVESSMTSELMQPLTRGGDAAGFLCALFWSSNIPCTAFVTELGVSVQSSRIVSDHTGSPTEETIDQMMREKASHEKTGFSVYNFWLSENDDKDAGLGFGSESSVQALEVLLRNVYLNVARRGDALLGIIINLEQDGGGHAVSLYPCLKGGNVDFVFCDTSRKLCHTNMHDG
jgi:hypothetical protein